MTELAWPLQTGNMPIVAWWPNLIVIFELTMLGAILATAITLFITVEVAAADCRRLRPEGPTGRLVGVRKSVGGQCAGARAGAHGRRGC